MMKPKKSRKHRQTRFKTKDQHQIIGKDKFSIEELLDQSSIQKIQGADLGRRNSRRDLGSQSPEQWIGDTSKYNFNILIQSESKQIDLLHSGFPLQTYITNQNQDYNYQLLEMQYDKIVRPIVLNQSNQQEKQEDQLINRMLNISLIEERKREEQLFNSRRQSVFQEKIEEFMKIVRRIADRKTDNKILSNSINMSRNSQFKQLIGKNLFQINEQWDNLQGTNKAQRIDEQDNGFSLKDAYNDGQFQQQLFKGRDYVQLETQRKVDSINLIKKHWLSYKSKKSKKQSQQQFKPNYNKARQSFNILPNPLQKQQDFNNILNELDESSNNNIGDKSQQLSLQYKQLKMLISHKPNNTKINSNSFCEQKRKKTQGDSMVLEHLGSISAIRSTSKFRQASQHDQSEIKQQDDKSSGYYSDIHRFLSHRQIWVKQKWKENNDDNWKRNQLQLVSKFKNMLKNPQESCLAFTKQISTNTNTSMNPLIDKTYQSSFDLKNIRNKQSLKNTRHLITRKTKSHMRSTIIKQKQKQITYIEDKKLSIILTKEQLKKLMSRETITNDIDINENQDISVETQQILTQLNFPENEIPPVKSRKIRYNIQLEGSFNDSIGRLL